jgi:hypothetical protein
MAEEDGPAFLLCPLFLMILLLLLLTTDGKYEDDAGFPGTRPASSRGLLGAQFATYGYGQTIEIEKEMKTRPITATGKNKTMPRFFFCFMINTTTALYVSLCV